MLKTTPFPSYIKYMGSKTKIIDYVVNGINEVRRPSATVLDLFAGSCSLAGAIGRQAAIHSNDIQSYSAVLADAYTNSWKSENSPEADQLLSAAEKKSIKQSETWVIISSNMTEI